MSEMVERVARAIFDAWATDVGSADSWEDLKQAVMVSSEEEAPTLHQMHRQAYAEARAAIEAMRDAGPNFSDSHLPFSMIDAGMTLLETAADDLAGRNGQDVPDWDYGMEAVAVYRSMIEAALASEPKP